MVSVPVFFFYLSAYRNVMWSVSLPGSLTSQFKKTLDTYTYTWKTRAPLDLFEQPTFVMRHRCTNHFATQTLNVNETFRDTVLLPIFSLTYAILEGHVISVMVGCIHFLNTRTPGLVLYKQTTFLSYTEANGT